MEGERGSAAQAHVSGCPRCRVMIEELSAIQTAAHRWGDAEPEPPAHVWTSVRAQLEAEGLIHDRQQGWLGRLREFFRPLPRTAFAGAYLAMLIIAALVLRAPMRRQINDYSWIHHTRSSTAPLGSELDSIEKASSALLSRSNPVVSASLHQNLAIIDNYIALCEKSVHDEPENEMARDYLYNAYQQKADLLTQMTEHGE
jgi:anti-sigma factor RsiW